MDWEGAGGFMNDSVAEEPQQTTGSVSVGGEDKNKSIAAVSISQITKFTRPTEGLVLHNKKVYHLNLVAFVCEILDVNSTKIHVLADDFTNGGPLEVTHIIGDTGAPTENLEYSMFNDNNPDPANGDQPRTLLSIKLGDYIRCIGVVKFNQDKPNFIAYNMRVIEDPNEITMHTLEVIRDSMFYERMQSKGVNVTTSVNKEHPATTFDDQKNGSHFSHLSTRDKHLLKFLRENKREAGLSFDEISANFKAFSRKDIEDSLGVLSSEGLCWQGDSEDLWCVYDQGV